MNDQLKPCPFCGGDPKRATSSDIRGNEYPEGVTQIRCEDCLAITNMLPKTHAIAAWNTRARETALEQFAADAVRALRDVVEGNDLGMERNQRLIGWAGSPFEKHARAVFKRAAEIGME